MKYIYAIFRKRFYRYRIEQANSGSFDIRKISYIFPFFYLWEYQTYKNSLEEAKAYVESQKDRKRKTKPKIICYL